MDFGDVFGWIQQVISTLGYPGITLLIALESFFPPIPSELILPLAGSLSAQGRFWPPLLIVAATAGSVVSGLIIYSVARYGGEPVLKRFLSRWGKWLLMSPDDIDGARDWFSRRGDVMVIIGRVTPGLRTLISVPAGLAKMPMLKFALFTAVGSGIWNGALVTAGWFLGENWTSVEGYLAPIAPLVYLGLLVLAGVFFWRRWQAKKAGGA